MFEVASVGAVGYADAMSDVMTQTSVRLPVELLARIERVQAALSARLPVGSVPRSDLLRAALERGVLELEREVGLVSDDDQE